MLPCTLAVLRPGPRTAPLSEAERGQVFGGHFANMTRMAKAGQLLLAGPYGAERSDPTLRGLFVFDTADEARAREWAATDPGVQAGVFALEFHPLSIGVDLREVLAAGLQRLADAEAAGRTPPPGEGARSYVLLTAEDGVSAAALLTDQPFVVATATLDGDRLLCWLDAADCAAAGALLEPLAARLGAHHLDDWFGSDRLAAVAAARGAR